MDTQQDMILGENGSQIDLEEYRKVRDQLSTKYKVQDGRRYSTSDLREAERSIDNVARQALAEELTQNVTLQNLYVMWLGLRGKGAADINGNQERAAEQDIELDFQLYSSIESEYFRELSQYDNLRDRLQTMFKEEESLEGVLEGLTHEIEEVKYVRSCVGDGREVDVAQLQYADPDLVDKPVSKLTKILRDYERTKSRVEQELSRLYLNHNLVGNNIKRSETMQAMYENQLDTVQKGIVATIEQMGGEYPVNIGILLGTERLISDRYDKKEKTINKRNRIGGKILSEVDRFLDAVVANKSPQFEQYGGAERAARNIADAIGERNEDNKSTLDVLKVNSERLRNQYKY